MTKAPLFEKIYNYCREDKVHFHIPGHRLGEGLPPELKSMALKLFQMDLTELPGLDDLHNPRGVIAEAQSLAAHLYNVDETFFLVNGTTCGLQALVMATAGEGEYILVPRNAHLSILGGLIFSGTIPVYLQPGIIPYFEIAAGISPGQVKDKVLETNCRAVLGVHPTYWGTVGNLPGLIDAAHQVDMPVIVDEAHGTHLYFSRDMPAGALECGADGVVQSVHKTGGALTQSSWLHVRGSRIDRKKLKDSLRLVQTTSPSYLLMASLDAARRQLAVKGEQVMDRVLEYARELRRSISRMKGLTLLGEEHVDGENLFGIDPTRLVISVKDLGLTGYEAREILSRRYGVEVEMADFNNIVAVISLGNTEQDVNRFLESMYDFSTRERRSVRSRPEVTFLPSIPPLRLSPRQAWMKRSRPVKIQESTGLVSGEMVCVYPPGIPVIYPGEEITGEVRDYLLDAQKLKLHCQGPEDPELNNIRVIDD